MRDHEIGFAECDKPAVRLPNGANLSETLTAQNSPILFGCRMGICGTCLVEVLEGAERLSPPTGIEREYLDTFAPPDKACRLACQLELNADILVRRLRE